jgi:hypothetical protein
LMLCQQQHVTHVLQAEQGWSKKWRNKHKFLCKQIRNTLQIMERLFSLSIKQLWIWNGVEYFNHLKHGRSFSIQYQ